MAKDIRTQARLSPKLKNEVMMVDSTILNTAK